MSSEQKTLSICIPTFNRATYLAECLQSIIGSSSRHQDRIEIVVSDNASTDGTENVVSRLQTERHPIRYVRQASNIGGASNFRAAAELASGQYVWLFGDDDKMRPDAVGAVLKAIELGAGAVICNTRIFSRDFQTIIKHRFLETKKDIAFATADRIMCRLGIHPGYISCVILNRQNFLGVPLSDYMSFEKDGSCFLYAAYCVFRNCRRVEFLAQPIVLNRGDAPEADLVNAHSAATGGQASTEPADNCWNRIFIEGFPRALKELGKKGYSRHAIRQAKTRIILDYILPRLMMVKNRGHGARALGLQALEHFKSSWALWLLLLPLAPLPVVVLRGIRMIKRGFNRTETL